MTLKSIMVQLAILVLVVISSVLVDAAAGTIPADVTAASFSRGSAFGINELELTQAVTTTGIAGTADLFNNHRAHPSDWNPLVADIGSQDLSEISLSSIYDSHPGSHKPTGKIPRKPPHKLESIPVPDSSNTLLLLGMGLGSLGLVKYRRKKE
jgi:hypothetical protein